MPSPPTIAAVIATCIAARLANGPGSPDEVEATASLWLADLAELTDEQLVKAATAHRRSSRWWPTPADLLDAIGGSDPHEAAWTAITRHVQRHGMAGSLREQLTTPQLRALAAVGGRWEISRAVGGQLDRIHRRFLALCRAELAAPPALEAPAAPALEDAPTGAERVLRLVEQPDRHAEERARQRWAAPREADEVTAGRASWKH